MSGMQQVEQSRLGALIREENAAQHREQDRRIGLVLGDVPPVGEPHRPRKGDEQPVEYYLRLVDDGVDEQTATGAVKQAQALGYFQPTLSESAAVAARGRVENRKAAAEGRRVDSAYAQMLRRNDRAIRAKVRGACGARRQSRTAPTRSRGSRRGSSATASRSSGGGSDPGPSDPPDSDARLTVVAGGAQ